MEFSKTRFEDLIICVPKLFKDDRGYFFESFSKDLLEDFTGKSFNFIQDNQSFSKFGTIRGLHFQNPPYEQTKLLRVIKGEILDIVVDIRKNSKTFGQHYKIILSEENHKQLLVPKGFAHGFIVKSQDAIISYKVDNVYSKKHESGIIFNDNDLNIDWEISSKEIYISPKDLVLPSFNSINL